VRRSKNGKNKIGTGGGSSAMPPREANMIAIIALGWLLAIWAIVIAFSVYFSKNLK
jgi:hypothetical protein